MDWLSILWITSYAVVIVGLCAFGVHRYAMVFLYLKHAKRKPEPCARFDELPTVTVQLPVYNELHVVERLLEAVARLDYAKDRLQIQVLDDSTDATEGLCRAEVAKLRAAGFDAEVLHRSDRIGYKAGALEAAAASAKGEFLFILDADFLPTPGLLQQMVHFFTDPQVGMIQARWAHLNRTRSFLTRLQAMFLDGHLVVEQTARSRSGRFFNFNGTAGIWRKSCIADAGGWQHDTLTEDLDLSYRAQMRGWKFVFLNDVEAPAELPVDIDGFKSQQHRWTKGSIQTCKKLLVPIWRSELPFLIKLEATAHLTANFAYLLLFVLCFLMYPGADRLDFLAGANRLFLIDLPVFFVATVSVGTFYACAQRGLRPRTWWRELLLLPGLLALGVGMSINNGKAVLEALFNRPSEFVRTPKYGDSAATSAWRRSSYKALRKSVVLALELLLAFYFTYLVALAWVIGYWGSVPFLALFMSGFWFVALSSAARYFPSFAAVPAAQVPLPHPSSTDPLPHS